MLRTSGQFSLNVSPSTSTRAPDGWMLRLIMSLIDAHRDVLGHAVVEAAAGEDDLGPIADFLGLVREVVRIDADAVAADETRA